jgi:hypothetical protein
MTDKEALKLALEALEACNIYGGLECVMTPDGAIYLHPAITAIKEALAQPEQEPVPTLEDLEQEIYQNTRNFISRDVMEWMLRRYYTHPPQRTEQNFCSRCGKRTPDLITIHTCKPPKD